MIKIKFIAILILYSCFCQAQIQCVPVNFTITHQSGTQKLAVNPTSLPFSVNITIPKYAIEILQENGFVSIDSQITQITLLELKGLTLPSAGLKEQEQRELLKGYVQYEIDYLQQELKIEVIDPNDQWVTIGQRKWLIWYFRVGKLPLNTEKTFAIQLYASTLEGEAVLTLNMPIEQAGDFRKSAFIMNAMMEGVRVVVKS